MKLHYWRHESRNFGDELNTWLWQRVLPEDIWSDDGVVLVGIGTIVDRNVPAAPRRIVIGAGTGYSRLPDDPSSPAWWFYGVRGPLSAKVLGLSPEQALTDPAILLSTLEEFRPTERRGTIFVPHWKSTLSGAWPEACRRLGIEFVDPCSEGETVIKRIASAELVIAESMHAAIIADAFRVPWIPVTLSSEVLAFKWLDWTASMGLPYRPYILPASTLLEAARHLLLRLTVEGENLPGARQPRPGTRLSFDDADRLIAGFHRRIAGNVRPGARWTSRLVEALMKRVGRFAKAAGLLRLRRKALNDLASIAKQPGELSSDADHKRALLRMQAALRRLERDHRAGFLEQDRPFGAGPREAWATAAKSGGTFGLQPSAARSAVRASLL